MDNRQDALGTQLDDVGQLLVRAARSAPHNGIRHLPAEPGEAVRRQTYPELLDESLRLLGALRALGVEPGRTVALLTERSQDFVPVFWACLLGGFVPCPLALVHNDPQRWAAHLDHVNTLLDGPLLVVDERMRERLPEVAGLARTGVEELQQLAAELSADPVAPLRPEPDDVALLMLTSGSTGAAKAVELTHSNLLASMAAKAGTQELTAADRVLTWISFDHVGALLETHLVSVAAGADQLRAAPEEVLTRPLRFLELISEHRVTMSFSPNFLLGLINKELDQRTEPLELDLSGLRHIVTGGEANPVGTGVAFLDALATCGLSRSVLRPAFGMTETCAGSIYNRDFPQSDLGAEFAAVGHAVPGLQVRIAGEAGTPDNDDLVGEVQLRGPMITRGYRNNEEATRASFTDDGWFRTGDLGRITDGRLTLVGRSKDSIIVNGINYFSHDLEAVLNEVDGIAKSFAAVFATRPVGSDTEQLVVAFAPTAEVAADESALYRTLVAIRNSVALHWGFRPSLMLPLPEESFVKTSLGKIQRSLMRRRLESGAYAEHEEAVSALVSRQLGDHAAPEGPAEALLAEIYGELFDVEPATISATVGLFDLGGTSLDVLRLKSLIDQRMPGSELPVLALLSAPSIRELAARIEADQNGDQASYDPIVPLQTSGTGTPLFCIHPGGGEVLVFVNLAKYFVHERPFYALRARGFGPGEQPFESWAELAGCYAEAIRARQPHGPYAIAGYSFGAAAAFEVAKILEASGERVDFLGSIDLGPHIGGMDHFDFAETAVNLVMFLGLISVSQMDGLADRIRPLGRTQQVEHLLSLSARERIAELDLDLARLEHLLELAHGLTELARVYQPSGDVASVTALYATPLRGSKEDWLEKHIKQWDQFSRGPNTYVEVPGAHHTLLNPEHIGAFQRALRAELDRALSGS